MPLKPENGLQDVGEHYQTGLGHGSLLLAMGKEVYHQESSLNAGYSRRRRISKAPIGRLS